MGTLALTVAVNRKLASRASRCGPIVATLSTRRCRHIVDVVKVQLRRQAPVKFIVKCCIDIHHLIVVWEELILRVTFLKQESAKVRVKLLESQLSREREVVLAKIVEFQPRTPKGIELQTDLRIEALH